MSAVFRYAAVLVGPLVLVGCMSSNFVRPDDDTFKLGKATRSQVIEKMGQPQTTGELISKTTGKKLTVVRYSHATPQLWGVKLLVYYFHDGVLVARNFSSSFPQDRTDWNESKVDDLIKGKTTRSEVLDMLGPPSGAYIWPAVSKTSGEAIGYHYTSFTSKFTAFGNKLSRHRKDLLITFDEKDRILDIDYGKRDDE